MATVYFKINRINYFAFIEHVEWRRTDVGVQEILTLDGVTHRNRRATKVQLKVHCIPLRDAEAMLVLNAIAPKSVTVEYTDPQDGLVTRTMYTDDVPDIITKMTRNGIGVHKGIVFTLKER